MCPDVLFKRIDDLTAQLAEAKVLLKEWLISPSNCGVPRCVEEEMKLLYHRTTKFLGDLK